MLSFGSRFYSPLPPATGHPPLTVQCYHLPPQGSAGIELYVKRTAELSHPESKGEGFNIIGDESPDSVSNQSGKLTAENQILEVRAAFVYIYYIQLMYVRPYMYVHAR